MNNRTRAAITAIILATAAILGAIPALAQIGDEPAYKFCRPHGTCAAMELTGCGGALNFCTQCMGVSTPMQKCKGSGSPTPCEDDVVEGMCGDEMIAYCSVDNCASYSPNGTSTCGGKSCIQ